MKAFSQGGAKVAQIFFIGHVGLEEVKFAWGKDYKNDSVENFLEEVGHHTLISDLMGERKTSIRSTWATILDTSQSYKSLEKGKFQAGLAKELDTTSAPTSSFWGAIWNMRGKRLARVELPQIFPMINMVAASHNEMSTRIENRGKLDYIFSKLEMRIWKV